MSTKTTALAAPKQISMDELVRMTLNGELSSDARGNMIVAATGERVEVAKKAKAKRKA